MEPVAISFQFRKGLSEVRASSNEYVQTLLYPHNVTKAKVNKLWFFKRDGISLMDYI